MNASKIYLITIVTGNENRETRDRDEHMNIVDKFSGCINNFVNTFL